LQCAYIYTKKEKDLNLKKKMVQIKKQKQKQKHVSSNFTAGELMCIFGMSKAKINIFVSQLREDL
jgi:hypothetical protein